MFGSGWMIIAVGALFWTTETLRFVLEVHYDRNALLAPEAVHNAWGHLATPSLVEPALKQATERPKIALISSYVTRNTSDLIHDRYLEQHLVNKACYASLWNYDYILNTTWGYPEETGHRFWLEYGHWHRVPAIAAAMDAGYEWILYADLDYVIQDMRLPLAAFFKEWDLAGKSDVHVLVPNDGDNLFTFSSYAILLRNSDFGRRVVQNWDKFAHGLCTKGNFEPMDGYHWELSDQPGLWYALTKTHAEFTGSNWDVVCNKTGYIQSTTTLYQETNDYFTAARVVSGSHGADLEAVPANQPIIFSRYGADHRSGLGVQRNWAFPEWKGRLFPHAFGMHTKYKLKNEMERDLNYCVQQRGCFARYDEQGKLEMGCNGTKNMVH